MTTFRNLAGVLLLVSLASSAVGQEAPQILSRLEESRIFEGDSVEMFVRVNNLAAVDARPFWEESPDYAIEFLGQTQSFSSQSVIIINGQVRRNSTNASVTFVYRLTPRRTGVIEIPAPRIDESGQVHVGNALTLEVLPLPVQDHVIVEIESDRDIVYLDETFNVDVHIDVRSLPEPNADRDQVNTLRYDRHLTIPWAKDGDFGNGLVATKDIDGVLGRLSNLSGRGFAINDLSAADSVFQMINRPQTSFNLPSRLIERTDAEGNKAVYRRYTFTREFKGTRPGRVAFGPVKLRGEFVIPVEPGSKDLTTEKIVALAQPIEIQIESAPVEGRPDTFTGGVGQFSISAKLDPTAAKVGDILTLTLSVKGKGLLDSIGPPDLRLVPEIAKHFRIYEATEATRNNARIFTYSLRPKDSEVRELAPIPFSYFDTAQRSYRTIETDAIPISIEPGDRLSIASLFGEKDAVDEASGAHVLRPNRETLRWDNHRRLPWLVAGSTLLLATFLLPRIVKVAGQRDWSGGRRRGSLKRARGHLDRGLAEFESGRHREAAARIHEAIATLIGDATDREAAALSERDIVTAMVELNLPSEVIERVHGAFEICEELRYSPGASVAVDLTTEVRTAVEDLARTLQQRGRIA